MNYNFNLDTRYLNGKIYRTYSKRLPKLQYIGSTIKTLDIRFCGHYSRPTNNMMSKLFGKYEDVVIELIEDFPCFNRDQLCYREQYYINKCKQENGIILNVATASALPYRLLPKQLLDWFVDKHPEHSTKVQFILLRDYE